MLASLPFIASSGSLGAQTPKIAPPPPCRTSATLTTASVASSANGVGETRRIDSLGVAVLEFDNQSAAGERMHFAAALTEGVYTLLRSRPRLNIASRGEVARAQLEAGTDLGAISRRLGVRYLLTGRTQPTASGVRVYAELRNADRGAIVWRTQVDHPSVPYRAIEEAIVRGVTATVAGEPASTTRLPVPGTRTPAAYEAYARGNGLLFGAWPGRLNDAIAAYEEAIRLDPSFSLARVRLARAHALRLAPQRPGPGLMIREIAARELDAIDALLGRDPTLAEAYTARAMLLRVRNPGRFEGARAAHEKAVSLAPRDADAHHEYGITLLRLGEDAAAAGHFRRALALENDRAPTLVALGELEFLGRRFGPACALLNAGVAANPVQFLPYLLRARVRLVLGELRDAFSDAETASRVGNPLWGESISVVVHTYARDSGRAREMARVHDQRLRTDSTLSVNDARYLAIALASVGNLDRAVEALSRARPRGAELRTALRDPWLDQLRHLPRFQRVMAGEAPPVEKPTAKARGP